MRFFLLLITVMISACADTRVVLLKSTPEGAAVTEPVKGALGVTPTQVVFSRGTFGKGDCPADNGEDADICRASFYFSKRGYQAQRMETLVKGERMIVHAYLLPIQTSLNISTFPDFSSVEISSQNEGGSWDKLNKLGSTIALNDESLWQGRDRLTLKLHIEALGYIPQTSDISILKGDHKQLEFTLNEYAIVGQIDSIPSGADVYERSLGYLGRTPFKLRIPYDQLVRISPQRRQNLEDPVYLFLELKKPGYQTVSKIASAGKIEKSVNPKLFSILVTLSPLQKKH